MTARSAEDVADKKNLSKNVLQMKVSTFLYPLLNVLLCFSIMWGGGITKILDDYGYHHYLPSTMCWNTIYVFALKITHPPL